MRSTEAAEPAEDEDDKYIRELERKRIEAQKARARFDLRPSITMVRMMGCHKFKLRSYHDGPTRSRRRLRPALRQDRGLPASLRHVWLGFFRHW